MRLGLDVTEVKDGDDFTYLIRDPETHELFEFSAEDFFLLNCFDGRKGADATTAEFENRFHLRLNRPQLDAFIQSVAEWGLLQGEVAPPAVGVLEGELVDPDDYDMGFDRDHAGSMGPGGRAGARRGRGGPGRMKGHKRRQGAGGRSRPGPQEPGGYADAPHPSMGSGAGEFSGADGIAAELGSSAEEAEQSANLSLFNGDALFHWLASIMSPLRYVAFLVPLLAAAGAWSIFSNVNEMVADFNRFTTPLNLVQRLLISMVTVNLISQIARGVICCGVGGRAPQFGIRMVFGLLPRFNVKIAGLSQLSRSAQAWVHGGPILVRLGLFGSAAILWLMSRPTGTSLSGIALLIAAMSILSLVITANPLLRANGYQLVTVWLGMPKLRELAMRALLRRDANEESQLALRSFALASLIFMISIIGTVLIYAARWLELEYQGTGVVIFLIVLAYLITHFRKQMSIRRGRRQQQMSNRRGMVRAGGGRGGHPAAARRGQAPRPTSQPEPKKNMLLRWSIAALLVGVMLLPYRYESGGPVEILPMQSRELTVEISGIVDAVNYAGGEYVPAGELIATITSDEEANQVSSTSAAIAEQEAKLAELLARPRPEEVALARQQLETARVKARFSSENADRMTQVYETGSISLDQYEDAKEQRDIDRAQVDVARAELNRVSSGAPPQEIEAARAELQGLKDRLSFSEQQVTKTQLRMPFTGRIATINLQDRIGQYLSKGEVFAVVEDAQSVRVQVEIPQADVGEIQQGSAARVKIWAYPDNIFTGEVVGIAPAMETQEYGKVVIVTTVIDNEAGLLKTGMTGFGKIDGGTKPVIVAFTRAIVRFFLIEFWSWLP